jgi:Disulfide bond formation protein DsbB
MSTDAVVTFLSLLALGTACCLFVVGVGLLSAKLRPAFVASIGPIALSAAAAITSTATLGSLYLSEVAHFTPCKLCWYQRIAMYASALMLLPAAVRADAAVRRFVVPLLSLGALVAVYHVIVERFPQLESSVCDPNNPCTLLWVNKFGFVTIPTMALVAFSATLGLIGLHRTWDKG